MSAGDEPDAARAALDRSRALVLPELIGRAVRARPDHPALAFGDACLTHAQLDVRAARLATGLAELGVSSGDRVALLLHNGFEFVESLLACHKLGACAVPVNFRLAAEEIEFILEDAGAVGVISGGELADASSLLATQVRSVEFHLAVAGAPPGAVAYEQVVADSPPRADQSPLLEDDLALLCYTSGTTGRPKGAMLSHRNLVASTLSWIHEMRASADDVWLSGQPMFHIGGINGLLPFLVLGATCVITPTTGFDADNALALLARHDVTMCIFVPTQWDAICANPRVAGTDVSRLRAAMWSASPASLATLERMTETFPNADIVSAYGQTEMAGATTLLKGPDAKRKMGSVGLPMLGTELRLVDDQLRDVGAGGVGEVVYRGPTVLAGYWRDDPASDEAFTGGWFHSGDLATRDDEGYLRLVDRKKDLIISGGENIYPAEVERALLEHPSVREVAVVGVPHPRWVETPLAFVVPAGDARVVDADLLAHLRNRVASYKKPSAIVVVETLPRNAAGKVLKRQLREAHQDRFATPELPTGG